jgi:hypothetical protein
MVPLTGLDFRLLVEPLVPLVPLVGGCRGGGWNGVVRRGLKEERFWCLNVFEVVKLLE